MNITPEQLRELETADFDVTIERQGSDRLRHEVVRVDVGYILDPPRTLPHDFAACPGKGCPSAAKCLRHAGVDKSGKNQFQVWAEFKPDERGRCDHFIEMRVRSSNETHP